MRSGRSGHCRERLCFVWLWKLCAVGPVFSTCVTSFLSEPYYYLQVLSEVLLCMLLCDRTGVSQSCCFFFSFNCAWIQIVVLKEEGEEKEGGGCYEVWGDGVTRSKTRPRVSVLGGGASGTPLLYESTLGSTWVRWDISVLCLCGHCGNH